VVFADSHRLVYALCGNEETPLGERDRDTIFISHATPEDNDFVRWLGGRLIEHGYTVWADVFHLKGGVPFWSSIEHVLRHRAAKVLFIVSRGSIDPARSGVRNELSVADGLRRSLPDPAFIVPIRVDDTPFDQLPIQIHQLNALDFSASRDARFADLLDTLVSAGVPYSRQGLDTASPAASPNAPGPRERPSIAVLPFRNLSGDQEQEYFADGIVDEIITGLSRIKWLLVISRNSTFTYKGRAIDVRQIGQELDVRYVLEGSVRRVGNQVRVTGQLVETQTGTHTWADHYDGTLDDIFALQDQLTMSVIGAVEPTLRRAEVERARRKRPDSLDAYDLFLRALPFATTAMPEDAERALTLLTQAVSLEPDYAAAHGFMAWCHEQRYLRGGLNPQDRDAARRHAHAAVANGSDDAMALAMGGFVIGVVERDYAVAVNALERSLALSPSSALAFGFSAIIRAWRGDYEVAIQHARMGIRLSPRDPLIYLPYVGLAYAHFFDGSNEDAAIAAGHARTANPQFSVPCYLQAASLHRLGRSEEASAAARAVMDLQPGFTVTGLVSGNITTPERMAPLAAALRELGLPE
jgi:TolB-like protein